MKTVLYVTNIEVPYKVKFFNQLSTKCDLTVLYERKESSNRDATWANSIYKKCFDGELFVGENKMKSTLKKFFIRGATSYLSAREASSESLQRIVGEKTINPYYFSSITEAEISYNATSELLEERYDAIVKLIEADNGDYERFLKSKSLDFSIERMVDKHIEAFGKEK